MLPYLHDTQRSVGLMDKASAPGAGDSRFESWADHEHPLVDGQQEDHRASPRQTFRHPAQRTPLVYGARASLKHL